MLGGNLEGEVMAVLDVLEPVIHFESDSTFARPNSPLEKTRKAKHCQAMTIKDRK